MPKDAVLEGVDADTGRSREQPQAQIDRRIHGSSGARKPWAVPAEGWDSLQPGQYLPRAVLSVRFRGLPVGEEALPGDRSYCNGADGSGVVVGRRGRVV